MLKTCHEKLKKESEVGHYNRMIEKGKWRYEGNEKQETGPRFRISNQLRVQGCFDFKLCVHYADFSYKSLVEDYGKIFSQI